MADEGDYTYDGRLDEIRSLYSTLPRSYLDNAAAPLYPRSLVERASAMLTSSLLISPHSKTMQADKTTRLISRVKSSVLELLNADPAEYEVVFCANATAALKIVGEALNTSNFAYSKDSHTSVVGLRELAKSYRVFESFDTVTSSDLSDTIVAWPLQSNFDGRRYPSQEWIAPIRQRNGLSLLDIASYAATSMPDFSEIKPDFAPISFYKIYGLPDLGALIVRKSEQTARFLANKRYFGGGTVLAHTPSLSFMVRKGIDQFNFSDFLEDGTVPFHTVAVLMVAIEEWKKIYGSFDRISRHVRKVAEYCRQQLIMDPRCTIFSPEASPIVTFKLNKLGHNEFALAASLADVHVRAGTLCNIGAFAMSSGLADKDIVSNHVLHGKSCNDDISYLNGLPTGVIRASIGPYSSYSDVDALLDVIEKVSARANGNGDISQNGNGIPTRIPESVTISALYTYPVKSCHGVSLQRSPILASGLLHDRAFCIVELATRKVLSLKRYRAMTFLFPRVEDETLTVAYKQPGVETETSISIALDPNTWNNSSTFDELILNRSDVIVDFFSNALGIKCTIAKSVGVKENLPDVPTATTLETRKTSTFANSSPLLIVSTSSAAALDLTDIEVFRPNIVLETQTPWAEDNWCALEAGSATIDLLGRCRRCNMICIGPDGSSDSKPYIQLCRTRKIDGKIYFGQHAALRVDPDDASPLPSELSVGQVLSPVLQ